jgi:hypothetical protein
MTAVASAPANADSVKLVIPEADLLDSDWELRILPGKDSDAGKDVVTGYQIGINSTGKPIKTGNGGANLTISWQTPARGSMLISIFLKGPERNKQEMLTSTDHTYVELLLAEGSNLTSNPFGVVAYGSGVSRPPFIASVYI